MFSKRCSAGQEGWGQNWILCTACNCLKLGSHTRELGEKDVNLTRMLSSFQRTMCYTFLEDVPIDILKEMVLTNQLL